MSQQTDASPGSSRPGLDPSIRSASPSTYTRPFRVSDDAAAAAATDRWRPSPHINEGHGGGLGSGELEGSTLGSSSRDGERGTTGLGSKNAQRKTQGPSSFLLGSSSFGPRSKALKTDHHQQHQHHQGRESPRLRHTEEDRREKRGTTPEVENLGSMKQKKKSRFSWNRHKHSVDAVSSEGKDSLDGIQSQPQSQNTGQKDENRVTPDSQPRSIGLDQDSLQIVSLALDLSESRRTGNLGRSASHRASGGAGWAPQSSPGYVDNHNHGGRTQVHQRSATHSYIDDLPREQLTSNEPMSVSNLLPNQTTEDPSLPQELSESTLARVAKARRHFELFGEYLRLLPSLPPLGPNAPSSTSASTDGSHGTHRGYNPLQVIRNRKVRFREKCPINIEVDGWEDVGAVHEWVSNIAHQYSGQAHGPRECLRLPQLRQWQPQLAQIDHDNEALHSTTSPPENGTHHRRSGSIKARRPRFDWLLSPAELLADCAWVEDGLNKAKLLNKDGNYLYPDPADLISSDTILDGSSGRPYSSSVKRVSLDVPADSHRSSNDYKKVSRGRSRHRGSSSLAHSSSASTNGTGLRQHSKVRSRSSSSVSAGPWMSERSTFSSPMSTKMPDERGGVMNTAQGGVEPPSKTSRLGNYHERPGSVSSAATEDDLRNHSTGPNSPTNQGFFPSMAINLSPPSSRSPSPSKRHFSRRKVSRHGRGKSKHRAVEESEKEPKPQQVDYERAQNPVSPDNTDMDRPSTNERTDSLPPQGQASPIQKNEQATTTDETTPTPRRSGQHESKLRGIFKGKGKLAEKVGSEVSRMGDFIMKKDHPAHSRQSSFATSVTSEEAEDERTNNTKITAASKNLLRRLPALADESPRNSRGSLEQTFSPKDQAPSQHASVSHVKQSDSQQAHGGSDFGSPTTERTNASQSWFMKQSQRKKTDETMVSEPGRLDTHISAIPSNGASGTELAVRKPHGHATTSSPCDEKSRLPVTGLAQAEATPPVSSYNRRPTMSGSWTISDRSIPTLADLGVFNKREIERTRALLLSSGIKAREITRRAETVRDPPEFLQNSTEPGIQAPKVVQLRDFDSASENLDRSFKQSQIHFQKSIERFPSQTASPLKSQLNDLENLVNNSLSPRVRTMGNDAENLIVSLNTKGPLTLKQLSDTLDRGVRKRRRRLRWVRRAGFVMLEWALVAMLWWVWLIVMAFKVFRGVFRGALSGIRWVLWL